MNSQIETPAVFSIIRRAWHTFIYLTTLLTLAAGNLITPGQHHGSALAAGPLCTVAVATGATYATIQAAVNDPGCATIQVAEGTYNENITITRSVRIVGADQRTTIVDGGAGCGTKSGDCTVFTITQPVTVTLSKLTIQNGYQTYTK